MSAKVTIHCDCAGCGSAWIADTADTDVARLRATARGWQVLDVRDVCPIHLIVET